MKIKTIDTKQGLLEYSITGTGKPILFLHGGHSNCQETLFHKGFDLTKYQLITPSRPGYGNTPLNNNTSTKKAAELIVSLLDYLNIDKVVVYGISAGGLSSIQLAACYPERVEKLILASATSKKWLDKNGKIYKTAQKLFNPKNEKIVWTVIRIFSKLFPKLVAHNFYTQFTSNKPHKLAKKEINDLLVSFKYFSSKSGFMCDIDQDIEDDLISKIKCPTLIIHSKNDNSVPFEHAEHGNKLIENSKLIGLDNEWGHLFWIGNDSNESIRRILEFIKS